MRRDLCNLGFEFIWLTLLGLLQKDPEDWFKGNASSDDQAEFDAIALRRQEARAAKDWAAADAARDEATAKGIVLRRWPRRDERGVRLNASTDVTPPRAKRVQENQNGAHAVKFRRVLT